MTSSALMAAAETLASVASHGSPQSAMHNLAPTKPSKSISPSSEPKKRTRPVSACEACRAKKVRCLLTPDAPVCQNCLSSGKECLFRVDDLAPALRAARFAHYGPPSANARTIASLKKQSYDRPRVRRKSEAETSADGAKGKSKAVFKSFANPTNLAAPLPIAYAAAEAKVSQGHDSIDLVLGLSRNRSQTLGSTPASYDNPKPLFTAQPAAEHPEHFSHDASYYGHLTAPHQEHPTASGGFGGPSVFLQPSPSDGGSVKSGGPSAHALYSASRPTRPAENSLKRKHSSSSSKRKAEEEVDPMSLAYYGHIPGPEQIKSEARSPPPRVSAELRDGIERWQRNGIATATTEEEVSRTTEEVPAPKPKILLPFFRWFGTTANTPGYRKIKIGVLQDSEVPGSDELGPALVGETSTSFSINEEEAMTTVESDLHRSPVRPPSPSSKGERAPSSIGRDLFELNRPRYPRHDILEHLVSLFLSHFKPSWCPWMDAQEVRLGAENGSMPAILANAICAVAARFSDRAELRRGPRKSSGDHFSDMAKVLIIPLLSFPSIEVIEALVILSYAEFAAGSDSGLWMYVGMALRMAQDLGLQHEASVLSLPNEEKGRLLFWAVVGLDRVTTFGTGRPVTIRETEIDTALPALTSDDTSDESVIFGHIIRILLLRGRMGEVLNQRTDDKRALTTMWLELAQGYSAYPASLHFNVQTFQRTAAQNQSPGFVYLHVLFQSTIGLLDKPSAASAAASRTIADILTLGDAFDDRCITASPYLDQLILPAGRTFLAERESAREALRNLGHGVTPVPSRPPSRGGGAPSRTSALSTTKSYADINLAACLRILQKLQIYWAGASWPLRALEQEAAGLSDPQAVDEDAQSAPIRDVEMVLKWAKSKLRSQQPKSVGTSTQSGDSPFGLGISADLTFDIDALMGAWGIPEMEPVEATAEFFGHDQSVWPLTLQNEAVDADLIASALQIPYQ